MANINDPTSGTAQKVDTTSQAARVTLYDTSGNPQVSSVRGAGVNLRTDGGTDTRDGMAVLLPGTSGPVVAGTPANPLNVAAPSALPVSLSGSPNVNVANFPATQPVSGAVYAGLRVGGADVGAGNAVPVSVTGSPTVNVATGSGVLVGAGNPLPVSLSGTPTVTVANQPSTQPVSGSLNADLRVGGSAVNTGNAVPVQVQNAINADVRYGGSPITTGNALPVAVQNAINADVRTGGSPVTTGNALPVQVQNAVNADVRVGGSAVGAGNALPVSVGNFPSAQGADVRVAGAAVSSANPVPISVPSPVTVQGVNTGSIAGAVSVNIVDETDAAAEFVAVIDIVPAAALADGATMWMLRNGGSKSIGIRRFDLQQGFSGTAAASRSAYVLQRFTAGAPTGGTAVTPARKANTGASTTATLLVGTAALTVTGVTWETAIIHKAASANQLTAVSTPDLAFQGMPLVLAPGEGVAIRASGAVILGSFLTGSVGWYEL